jgi:Zn-finger nucleic acid-binding protein
LRIAHRQGVEIDVCSECRGVWLDRGELDKIIERYQQYDDDSQQPRNKQQLHQTNRQKFWQDLFD